MPLDFGCELSGNSVQSCCSGMWRVARLDGLATDRQQSLRIGIKMPVPAADGATELSQPTATRSVMKGGQKKVCHRELTLPTMEKWAALRTLAILALVRSTVEQENAVARFHEGLLRCCICTYIVSELGARGNSTVNVLESICAHTRRPFGTRCKKVADSIHLVLVDGELLSQRAAAEICWRTEHCRRRREPYQPASVQLATAESKPGIYDHLLSVVTSGDVYGASAPPKPNHACTNHVHKPGTSMRVPRLLTNSVRAAMRRLQVGPGSGQRPSHPRSVAEATAVPNIVHFIFGLQRVRRPSSVGAAPARPTC
jgi:hypothetical protein